MSSILKALKKLEEEKVARNPESLNINAELLSGGASAGRTSAMKTVAFGLLLAACGASGMYFYMKKGAAPAPPSISSVSLPQSTDVAGSGQVKKTAPLPAQTVPTARIETEKIAPAASLSAVTQPDSAQRKPVKSRHQTPVQTAKSPVAPIASRSGEQAKNIAASPKPSVSTPAAQLPALKVSGIAYQDGVDSVAMINGVTASNGSVVEGARVDRILRDRVQFSYGAEKFEIQLGKSNR